MEYGSEVRQRFPAPARAGVIPPGVGTIVAGAAEDQSLRFWVRFQVELAGGTIGRVRFQAYGCPHGLAAADLVASELEGKPVDAMMQVDLENLAARIELPREKHGKLLRIEDALAACHRQAVARNDG
jgi:NifU-like protein involved in Fe-S cluster formation